MESQKKVNFQVGQSEWYKNALEVASQTSK